LYEYKKVGRRIICALQLQVLCICEIVKDVAVFFLLSFFMLEKRRKKRKKAYIYDRLVSVVRFDFVPFFWAI